jgi:hypothetical protein
VICSRCSNKFSASRTPGLVCDDCFERSRLTRSSAAIPAEGKHAGVPRPLKAMTGYRQRMPTIPRAYWIDLD